MNITQIQELVKKDSIVLLMYGGFLSQTLISSMTEALGNKANEDDLTMSDSINIFIIFVELTQNMMSYSKNKERDSTNLKSDGLIIVEKDIKDNYYIHTRNIVDKKDKEIIELKLNEILISSPYKIKEVYKELRISGRDTHKKGGGIGFYEIAKRCKNITFKFKNINENKFYFDFNVEIKIKDKN